MNSSWCSATGAPVLSKIMNLELVVPWSMLPTNTSSVEAMSTTGSPPRRFKTVLAKGDELDAGAESCKFARVAERGAAFIGWEATDCASVNLVKKHSFLTCDETGQARRTSDV